MDANKTQAPVHETRGYLVIVDARRARLAIGLSEINTKDGMKYATSEISYDPKYHEIRKDFEPPNADVRRSDVPKVMLNESFELRGTGCSTSEDGLALPRHRWYPIKEGFSPKVFKAASDSMTFVKGDTILDPFCGSGTVPVTATLQGRTAYGIEVNPFLAFVSRAKLIQCSPVALKASHRTVLDCVRRGAKSYLESYSTFCKKKVRQSGCSTDRSFGRSKEAGRTHFTAAHR